RGCARHAGCTNSRSGARTDGTSRRTISRAIVAPCADTSAVAKIAEPMGAGARIARGSEPRAMVDRCRPGGAVLTGRCAMGCWAAGLWAAGQKGNEEGGLAFVHALASSPEPSGPAALLD